jgi:hypothetical protein
LLREEFEEKIRAMKVYNKDQFHIADDRMDAIEGSIKKEILDRIVESDEQIYVVRNDL